MTTTQMLLIFLGITVSDKEYVSGCISDILMKNVLYKAHENEYTFLYPYLTEMVKKPENERVPSDSLKSQLIDALHHKIYCEEGELVVHLDTLYMLVEKIKNSTALQDKVSIFQQLIPIIGAAKYATSRIKKYKDIMVLFTKDSK